METIRYLNRMDVINYLDVPENMPKQKWTRHYYDFGATQWILQGNDSDVRITRQDVNIGVFKKYRYEVMKNGIPQAYFETLSDAKLYCIFWFCKIVSTI